MRPHTWLLSVVLFLGLASPAFADDTEQAKLEYQQGQKFYNLGEFGKAAEHWRKAYELVPRPILLFNLAQAYRLGGDAKQALFFYESFLRAQPETNFRPEVEGRIKEMRTIVDSQKATTPVVVEPPPTEPPPEPRTPVPSPEVVAEAAVPTSGPDAPPEVDRGRSAPLYKRWWFWAGVGVVIAGGVAVALVTAPDGGEAGPPETTWGNAFTF